MRIEVSSAAIATSDGGEPLSPGAELRLQDERVPDVSLADHLDFELARIGLVGGQVSFAQRARGLTIVVTYWSPRQLDSGELDELRKDTVAQLVDGAGENGFELDLDGRLVRVVADESAQLTVEQIDDGRVIPPASRTAIAAYVGDLVALREALAAGENVEGRLQGYTGLHLAILFAHAEIATELIAHGADPNALDPQSQTPLHLSALSNHLNDAASRTLVEQLVAAGSNVGMRTSEGQTAGEFAIMRKKAQTAAFLNRA